MQLNLVMGNVWIVDQLMIFMRITSSRNHRILI